MITHLIGQIRKEKEKVFKRSQQVLASKTEMDQMKQKGRNKYTK